MPNPRKKIGLTRSRRESTEIDLSGVRTPIAIDGIRLLRAVCPTVRSRIELNAITRCHPDGSPGDLRKLAGAARGGSDERATQALSA